jgi:hypothetical protein
MGRPGGEVHSNNGSSTKTYNIVNSYYQDGSLN